MANCVVAQSGGPTAAINATLAGVIYGALTSEIDLIYGAVNGIEGVIKENLLVLNDVFENSFPWIKKATCVIEYGKPVYPEQLSKEERKAMGAYCRNIITGMLKGHEQYLVNNPSKKKK